MFIAGCGFDRTGEELVYLDELGGYLDSLKEPVEKKTFMGSMLERKRRNVP